MSESKCSCAECEASQAFAKAFNDAQQSQADRISQLEADCAAMREALDICTRVLAETIKAINDACGSRPAWTSAHQATLVWKTMADNSGAFDVASKALSLSAGHDMLEEHKAEVQDAKNRAECFREGCYTLRANVESCRETITELQESLARTVKGTQGDICPACGTEFEKGEFQRCGGSIIKEVVDLRAKLAESEGERERLQEESREECRRYIRMLNNGVVLENRLALAERRLRELGEEKR